MKTSIKMIAIAIATLAAGSVMAHGYVTSTDTSSFSAASVSSGSIITTNDNGAAYSNQVVGAGAQNTATAGANAGHGSVGTVAGTSGVSGALAASQSGASGNATVDAGTDAIAVQTGSAEAYAAKGYRHPSLSAESEAGVGSISGASTGANGVGGTYQVTEAGNGSFATRDGRGNTVGTGVGTGGVTTNYAESFGSAGSAGFAGQEGNALSVVH